jgi:hypothetical protein
LAGAAPQPRSSVASLISMISPEDNSKVSNNQELDCFFKEEALLKQ